MRKLKFDLSVQSNALLCPNPTEFYSKAYITEDVAANFRLVPGVKNSTKISNVLFSNLLQTAGCAWSTQTDTLDAKTISVCSLDAMAQICQFDMETSFLATQLATGGWSNVDSVPAFMAYYFDIMSKEIGAEIATLRWQGDTGLTASTYLKKCDGHEKLLKADGSVIGITGASGGITTANVITEMNKVVNALPTTLSPVDPDLRFHVSSNVATNYMIASATGNTNVYITQPQSMTFLGIPVIVNRGMSNNKMVLTRKDNLIYAFDGADDAQTLKAVNLADTTAEPYLRVRANLKVGFAHVNPTEIVFYGKS